MSGWDKQRLYQNRNVGSDNGKVKCYIDGGFSIDRHNGFIPEKYEEFQVTKDYNVCNKKTFVLSCGSTDGESIDLFDLQKWFDDNREWINSLREECKE